MVILLEILGDRENPRSSDKMRRETDFFPVTEELEQIILFMTNSLQACK